MLHWKCSSRFAPLVSLLSELKQYNFLLFLFKGSFCIHLLQDENRRSEEREWMGNKYLIHFFDYETKNKKYIIWGLTAGILIRAASIVYKRSPPFVEQNPIYKVPRVVDINTTIP